MTTTTPANPTNTTIIPSGGQGGHAREEMKMAAQALKRGWEIPEQVHKFLPAMMFSVVAQKDSGGKFVHTPRERIAAARVLALMHGQNQKDDPAPQTHLHAHEHRVQLTVEQRREALLARLDQPGDGGRS